MRQSAHYQHLPPDVRQEFNRQVQVFLTDKPLLDAAAIRAQIEARDLQMDNPYSKDAQIQGIRNARRYLGDRLGRVAAPIGGLYAVGEVAGFGGGGVHGYNALEGTFLGGCLFSGRAAGRDIANSL